MTKAERKAAQEAEDRAYRAEWERRAEAKRRVREVAVRLFGPEVGCGDGGCIFGHHGGMHTNGGCCCVSTHRADVHDVGSVARMLSMIAHELAKPEVLDVPSDRTCEMLGLER
jgi:hypothetical protein